MLIAVGLVTAYYLLPPNERGTAGASMLLVCGLVAVLLVLGWEVRAITRSPHPRLEVGSPERFDRAPTDFAQSYADQNERDYEELEAACRPVPSLRQLPHLHDTQSQ